MTFIAVKLRNTHKAVDFVSKTVPQNNAITRQSASQWGPNFLHQSHISQWGNKCQFTASEVYLYYIRIENYSQTSEFQACKFEQKKEYLCIF